MDNPHKDSEMITLEDMDMSCGHCVSTITGAVHAVDPGAEVPVDLPTHRVRIESKESDAGRLGQAIRQAGFTPVGVSGEEASSDSPVARGGGCCC
jgi:copper chaperone